MANFISWAKLIFYYLRADVRFCARGASGGAAVARVRPKGHLRHGFRRKGDAKKMSGNGWLCDKVRILFWNWPKSSPFFHAEYASCGVLAGDSGV